MGFGRPRLQVSRQALLGAGVVQIVEVAHSRHHSLTGLRTPKSSGTNSALTVRPGEPWGLVAGVLTGCRQERERERGRKEERKKERERKIERLKERQERDRPETSLALGRGLFSSSAASLCTHSFKKVVPSHPVEPAS